MEAGSTKPAEVPSSCDGSTTMGCSSDLNRFDDPDDDPVDRLAGCKGEIIPVLCLCESVSSHEVTLGINLYTDFISSSVEINLQGGSLVRALR